MQKKLEMLDGFGKVQDRFEEWLSAPLSEHAQNSTFEVRRSHPSDYQRIYDLVDGVFGFKRPRSHYQWLYERNPNGKARCWMAFHRESGQLVASQARFPWPLAWGGENKRGLISGDYVTALGWQRQGIYEVLRIARDSHPWNEHTISIGFPNEKTIRQAKKSGRGHIVMGSLPRRALLLQSRVYLEKLGTPRPLALIGGAAADAVLGAWKAIYFSSRNTLEVKEVRTFDSAYDEVTRRCMGWSGYWCPHGADFLNWRYLEHPTKTYVGLAMMGSNGLAGYCVVRLDEQKATIMDFAAPPRPDALPRMLLFHAIRLAREAGCHHVDFFGTPRWPHWRLLRRAGFMAVPSEVIVTARCVKEPQVSRIAEWQLVPGDSDIF